MSGRTMTNLSTEEIARFWARLGPKRQAVCAWDVEEGQRLQELTEALESFGCLPFRGEDGEIYLLAWIRPLGPEAATGLIHFANAGTRDEALTCWPAVRDYARRLGFTCLLAWLPVCFRHARAFARDIGFRNCCRLPRAAWLASRGRCGDAEMLCREIQ